MVQPEDHDSASGTPERHASHHQPDCDDESIKGPGTQDAFSLLSISLQPARIAQISLDSTLSRCPRSSSRCSAQLASLAAALPDTFLRMASLLSAQLRAMPTARKPRVSLLTLLSYSVLRRLMPSRPVPLDLPIQLSRQQVLTLFRPTSINPKRLLPHSRVPTVFQLLRTVCLALPSSGGACELSYTCSLDNLPDYRS